MKRLLKWLKADPEIRKRDPIVPDPIIEPPVTIESVAALPIPESSEIRQAQADLVQAMLMLGRRSHDLRIAMGDVALANMTGGHSR